MDYEYKLRILEKELAHYREMQAITSAHMDAHDKSFGVVGDRMDRIEASLDKLVIAQSVTEVQLQTVAAKLERLIDALTSAHTNGGSKH